MLPSFSSSLSLDFFPSSSLCAAEAQIKRGPREIDLAVDKRCNTNSFEFDEIRQKRQNTTREPGLIPHVLFVTRIFHNCLKYFKSSSSVAIQDGFKVPVRKGKLCQGLLRADIKLLLD